MNKNRALRVLVVEDEALICMTLQDVLEDLGCELALACTTLQQAIIAASGDGFDVAILDVNLNGEDVTEVGIILQQRAIPIIFSTGYGKSGVPTVFSHYPLIEKPFRDIDVEAALHAAMKGPWKHTGANAA
jgi:CheY-like chemotaxis protein